MSAFSAVLKRTLLQDFNDDSNNLFFVRFGDIERGSSEYCLFLHWAIAEVDEVGEDVVKTIYLSHPAALEIHTRDLDERGLIDETGYTPLHLLNDEPQSKFESHSLLCRGKPESI